MNLLASRNYAITMTFLVLTLPLAYATAENMPVALDYASTTRSMISTTSPLLVATTTTLVIKAPEDTFSTEEKVRKGKVKNMDNKSNSFTLTSASSSMKVYHTATTTFYTGEGEELTIDGIDSGAYVYVFGFMKKDKSAIVATKIVTANKVKFQTLRQH